MKINFFLLFALIIFTQAAQKCNAQTAELTVKVIAPHNTPANDSIIIAGNQTDWGNWYYPDSKKMQKINDTTFIYQKSFPKNTLLTFKILRGSYYKEALYGGPPGNAITTNFSITADTTVKLHPSNWNDLLNRSITGTVKYLHNYADHNLKYTRDVIVWLPPSYFTSKKRYPVLYAHDGQNLFDASTSNAGEWHLDETADSLIHAGATQEFIIVAIANTKARWVEYSGAEEGRKYVSFIVNNLKPYIDAHFRTKPDRENTAAMGSSMGGLISFYMVWWYPDIFSKAACLSSGFAFDEGNFMDSIRHVSPQRISGARLYLDCGDQGLDKNFLPDNEKIKAWLGSDRKIDLEFKIFPGETHNEQAWAKRLWQPLEFLFGEK